MTRYLRDCRLALLLSCGRFIRAIPGIADTAVSGGAAALV